MRKKIVLFLAIAAIISTISCMSKTQSPKNIIFFIGDGMGVSQVTAGKHVAGTLNMEKLKVMGLATNYAADNYVTDSAASGTALATGFKTNNGFISVSTDSTPFKTLFEYAKENGKSAGVAVTCALTHATPAAFISHVTSRNNYNEIAEQIAAKDYDVLFGGGWCFFVPDTVAGSKRKDSKDLIAEMSKKYKIIKTREEFEAQGTDSPVVAFLAEEHLPQATKSETSLAEMTAKAIEILSKNEKGFVLMVEGSQIDWAGHNNDAQYLVEEVLDFDKAVGVGIDYAIKSKNTLVVVTADHETGGFALLNGSIEQKELTQTSFAWNNHTATMVPVFAYGPGSAAFGGIQDNTYIGKTLIDYCKIK